jgi:hypothetical protein
LGETGKKRLKLELFEINKKKKFATRLLELSPLAVFSFRIKTFDKYDSLPLKQNITID